jgi:hypothetical protein
MSSIPAMPYASAAIISDCGQYRTILTRIWEVSKPPMIMIGLNPSTADGTKNDPTIVRNIGFARRENCGGLIMLNLSAYRSTNPKALKAHHFGAGDNNRVLTDMLRAVSCFGGKVVCAYGAHPLTGETARWFVSMARHYGVPLYCLGRTKDRSPRHPLYIRADQPLELFSI